MQMKHKRAILTAAAVATSASLVALPNVASAASQPVTIQFWYGLGGQLGSDVEQLIKEFNASQHQVIVQGVVQPDYSTTQQKLQAAIAAHAAPAAALLGSISPTWAKQGVFTNLTSLIAKDPGFKVNDFMSAFLQGGQYAGKQYGLPLYGTTQVLYYRKDLFQKAGISPSALDTWQGLAAAAKKISVKNGGQVSVYGWEPMWGPDNLIDAVYSAGGRVISADGTKVLINSPVWVKVWSSFGNWLHKDNTMRIHSGGTGWAYWYATIDDVMHGKAAGYTGSSGDQESLNFKIISAHQQPGWGSHKAAPEAGSLYGVIPSQASPAQQQAAFQWLTFFTNAQNTAKWSMETGYIPVRKSAMEIPAFKQYLAKHPQAKVPIQQAQISMPDFNDPTGSLIYDAISKAADAVEIEGVPAKQALDQAEATAQSALTQYLKGKH